MLKEGLMDMVKLNLSDEGAAIARFFHKATGTTPHEFRDQRGG
jgi:hypothetical protein